jgi:hypothetical protein
VIQIENNVLIYDIETRTFDNKPNPDKDRLRIFGCYSYKTKKKYLLKNKDDVQKIIDAHKFLVGFNNEYYDDPILKREGINMKYKIIIDLRKIIKGRAGAMKVKQGMLKDVLMRYSLDYITRTLGIVDDSTAKEDIDYSIFGRDDWTEEEEAKVIEYTKRDIDVTRKLYEWVEDYFWGFRDFIKLDDIKKKVYLTASIAKFSYKAICKAMGWEETYGDAGGKDHKIGGGYVAYPAGEKFEGDIYCLDFNSLYPHCMIQYNLYGRKKETNTDNKPTISSGRWKVNGTYYTDKLSGVGELFRKWYADRVVYKKEGDRREYTLKIILNTSYGILNTPFYTLVYDRIAGGDCTRLGRQWTKYARKVFRENGYQVVYTDTDSVYIVDPFKDKERMLKVKTKIIDYIKGGVPFPQDTFDMGIDDEIKYMFFFRGSHIEDKESDKEMDEDDFINKPKGFLKKNYIYITKDNKLKLKNLGVRKKSNSMLSRKIFWDYLVPKIIETGNVKFSRTYIQNLINELLEKDITLAAMRKEVNESEFYKVKSTQQSQISERYGAGIHFLIPNNRGIGIGKAKKFCSINEFKRHKLKIHNIDLTGVFNELGYFIKKPITANIFSFDKRKEDKNE